MQVSGGGSPSVSAVISTMTKGSLMNDVFFVLLVMFVSNCDVCGVMFVIWDKPY